MTLLNEVESQAGNGENDFIAQLGKYHIFHKHLLKCQIGFASVMLSLFLGSLLVVFLDIMFQSDRWPANFSVAFVSICTEKVPYLIRTKLLVILERQKGFQIHCQSLGIEVIK